MRVLFCNPGPRLAVIDEMTRLLARRGEVETFVADSDEPELSLIFGQRFERLPPVSSPAFVSAVTRLFHRLRVDLLIPFGASQRPLAATELPTLVCSAEILRLCENPGNFRAFCRTLGFASGQFRKGILRYAVDLYVGRGGAVQEVLPRLLLRSAEPREGMSLTTRNPELVKRAIALARSLPGGARGALTIGAGERGPGDFFFSWLQAGPSEGILAGAQAGSRILERHALEAAGYRPSRGTSRVHEGRLVRSYQSVRFFPENQPDIAYRKPRA